MNKIILLVEIICLFSLISACSDDPPTAPEGASSDWDNSTKVKGTLVTYTCITGEEAKSVCDEVSLTWKPSNIMCPDAKRIQNFRKIKVGKKVKKKKKTGKKTGKKGNKRTGVKGGKKTGKKYGDVKPQSCTCGVKKTSRIIGGQHSQIFDWPWIARLGGVLGNTCAGSLIADQWILSAAHCTRGIVPSQLAVSLGDHDSNQLDTSENLFVVSEIINHKFFSPVFLTNDISLIKLRDKVDLNKYTPVCLPNAGTTYVGEMVDVYGWGLTSPPTNWGSASLSTILLETRLEVITNKVCSMIPAYIKKGISITDRHLCAHTEGTDACQGDSGGPMTYDDNGKHKQIGIVSFGEGCAEVAGVYTRVTKYLGWIKKKIEANGGAVYCNN